MNGPRLVIILSDGIRGHVNQSRGVALWLSRLGGCPNRELTVPKISSAKRFLALKVRLKTLPRGDRERARRWLEKSEGMALMIAIFGILEEEGLSGRETLFLSTGSTAAPYCLALARFFGARAATVMTPSILGTRPFDYAVVPAHDCPRRAGNTYVTLGAPNAIETEKLKKEAEILFAKYPPDSPVRWGVLIGGDDRNYRISGGWIHKTIGFLVNDARKKGADLYLTTSRRTSPDAERALESLAGEIPAFRMMLLASKDPSNPVPGILGGCQEVFCTEDSVSMVSETATAGFVVRLLRVDRQRGLRWVLQQLTAGLVKGLGLPGRFLWGAPRFDAMLESFAELGLLVEGRQKDFLPINRNGMTKPVFNEARGAAAWIMENWENQSESL